MLPLKALYATSSSSEVMDWENERRMAQLECDAYDSVNKGFEGTKWSFGGGQAPPRPENIRNPVGGMFFRARIPIPTNWWNWLWGLRFAVYWGYCNVRSDRKVVGEVRFEDVRAELCTKQYMGGLGAGASAVEEALQGVDPDDIEIELFNPEQWSIEAAVRPVVSAASRCDPSERSEASRAKTF